MQESTRHIKNGKWTDIAALDNDILYIFSHVFKKTLEENGVFVYSRLIVG